MSRRFLLASFSDEGRLLAAVKAARAAGQDVLEVFGPWPVHGLPEALGQKPSRLPWACLGFGAFGFGLACWLEAWTSAVDWPLNVGGKPNLSIPAFIPVAFALTVLCAGVGVVLTFLLSERKRPRPVPSSVRERLTDDWFQVTVGATDATWDVDALSRQWTERWGAVHVEEVLADEGPGEGRP